MRSNRRMLLKAAGALGITSITGVGSARLASQEGQGNGEGQARERENMRLLDQNTLDGNGNIGEGYAIKETDSGDYILYLAHSDYGGPIGLSVIDVTDPRDTELLTQFEVPSDEVRWNNLDSSGDLLIVASEGSEFGAEPVGLFFFDISNPTEPEEINFYDLSGDQSEGPHFVWMVNDEYAHISTGAGDFDPVIEGASQFYMIVDVSDPESPEEVSRWWYPGASESDDEELSEQARAPDGNVRLHNVNVYPDEPDRAYLAYLDAGVVILDISDRENPEMVGEFDPSPPLPGFTHTATPLFSRDLLVVADETIAENCEDEPKLVWLYDISDETQPMPIAAAPRPDNYEELCDRGSGRSGAHNVHENMPDEPALQSDTIVYAANFNQGVRVYDTSDRFHPEEIAYYVPEAPEESDANVTQLNDLYVDDRGVVYTGDRVAGGLYTLALTGDIADRDGVRRPPEAQMNGGTDNNTSQW